MIPLLSVFVLIGSCLLAYWLLGILNLSFHSFITCDLSERFLTTSESRTSHMMIFLLILLEVFCLGFIFIYVYEYGTDIGQERVFAFPRPELQAVVSHLV